GAKYMQELLRINLTTQSAVYKEIRYNRETLVRMMREGSTVNIDGYELAYPCYEQVSAINLKEGPKRFAGRCLIVQIGKEGQPIQPDLKALQEKKYQEIYEIIKDIGKNQLTDIELTSYVTANYTMGMSDAEILNLTKAMTLTGTLLKVKKKPVVDIHCIGGVPGNRTTMIVVPILVAAGLTVPKTSSRAITSPAGTADTMEVLCPVSLPISKLYRILDDVGGFIVWGGSVNLAPADDRIIKVEHPLSIDAEGQMLASIMAKKASVSATHLLMDIPVGRSAKIEDRKQAVHLQGHFERLGNALGIKVCTMITPGSEPIGNGIGPVLEARDCLWVLKNDSRAPQDLRRKSLEMAAVALEFAGTAKKGEGMQLATEILNSGKAYQTFMEMVKAQGGKDIDPESLKPCPLQYTFLAPKSGTISVLDNTSISRIARMAGAPRDKDSGILLHHHCGDHVNKGDPIMTIYSHSREKLGYAIDLLKELNGIIIQ
ncbi:MAG: thymidine phosphorylase, partial [Candidatus Woesearchaeota archaeon]